MSEEVSGALSVPNKPNKVSVDVKHYVLLYVVSKRRILSKIRAFCLVLSSSKAFSLTSCVFLIVVKKKIFLKTRGIVCQSGCLFKND